MKNSKQKKWMAAVALVGIPLSAFAVVTNFDAIRAWETGEIGWSNSIYSADRSLSVGSFNNHGSATDNASIGYALDAPDSNCLVAGQWNETSTAGDDDLFILGNGTGWNDKSNALEVYKNGDVIIPKAQGDIDMGGFGSP